VYFVGYGMECKEVHSMNDIKMLLYVIHGSEYEEVSVSLFSKYLHGLFEIRTMS
jgi:hypothetical protein